MRRRVIRSPPPDAKAARWKVRGELRAERKLMTRNEEQKTREGRLEVFAGDKGLHAGSGEFGSGNYGCSWRWINKSNKKGDIKKKEGKKRWKSPPGLTAKTSSFSELCGAEQIVLKKAPCASQSLRILQPRENVSVTCTAVRGQLVGESGVHFAFLNELLHRLCVCVCVRGPQTCYKTRLFW